MHGIISYLCGGVHATGVSSSDVAAGVSNSNVWLNPPRAPDCSIEDVDDGGDKDRGGGRCRPALGLQELFQVTVDRPAKGNGYCLPGRGAAEHRNVGIRSVGAFAAHEEDKTHTLSIIDIISCGTIEFHIVRHGLSGVSVGKTSSR